MHGRAQTRAHRCRAETKCMGIDVCGQLCEDGAGGVGRHEIVRDLMVQQGRKREMACVPGCHDGWSCH